MNQEEQQKQVWDQLWSNKETGSGHQWDPLSNTIYDEIVKLLPSDRPATLLEAGSGTGRISLRLAAEGAEVTLVDYSAGAISNSQRLFQSQQQSGRFILSDIRNINLPDGGLDMVWNSGVLEHFDQDQQIAILKEMKRLTKPGGTVLVLTPSARSLPYLVGKYAAEQQGNWMYGIEHPVWSLQEVFAASGLELQPEYHIGFENSLDFLDFIGGAQPVKEWMRRWYQSLPDEARDVFAGYLLVSVARV